MFAFGPSVSDHGVEFRLWAPSQRSVFLQIDGIQRGPMRASSDGWHHYTSTEARPGSLYSFVLDSGLTVPDPASRFQPDDVHGQSEVINGSSFTWSVPEWRGRPWDETVLYELHIGAFTQQGTFLAAIDRLDHLQSLGITAIQIMPVADFPGRRGWGYDGVYPYAPESSYGRPEHLKRLIDEAHLRGISVFLDVVYNHFGPDGNYMPGYAPLFTDRHDTPWGPAVNFDGESSDPIRQFILENAIYWITEFRFDGLRLDAVHAMKDDGDDHILDVLARRVREAAGNRHVHLIVENEENDSDLLTRDQEGRAHLFDAQWNDDIHHALHVLATDETFGYYADYTPAAPLLGKTLAEGFVFQGQHMPYRGKARGKRSADLPPTAFISFIQNHDQIGNRAMGDRVISGLPDRVIRALASIYLLAPQIPMLFMGEEWNANQPFPYFCDFDAELNEKVRRGRREELSKLPGFDADDLLDPTEAVVFESAKLDWSKLDGQPGAQHLSFYANLLALRRRHILPLLGSIGCGSFDRECLPLVSVRWPLSDGRSLHLLCNPGNEALEAPDESFDGEKILHLGTPGSMIEPWSVFWSVSV
ncbi:malto-oligosyltrehalose trehalohydrolase [Rhizobium sp. S152]|nr:malto-oligosyltrehalose trehalohydrolase [Rhizobium sp. S152]MDM9625394.1 malto-oligosyltrehalose trehalohydrolase [Rhizobium sp. S152]